MNRRQKIIVSITGIVIVSLFLIGLTYGYFLTKISGNNNDKSISVTTADLKLVYNDGSDGVIGGELLIPSDTEYTKTFTVKNEGNTDIDYAVYLIDVINTFVRKDDIKYTLSCTTNGTIACNGVSTDTTFPSGINQLVTNTIEEGKTHTYTFKFTYKDTGTDQSIDMNKELSAKIQIYGKNGNNEYFPYENGTLTATIISNVMSNNGTTTYSTEPKTTIGSTSEYNTGNYETVNLSLEGIEDVYQSNSYISGLSYLYIYENEDFTGSHSRPSSWSDTVGKWIYDDLEHKEVGYVEEYDETNKNLKVKKKVYASEKTLSIAEDNEGTSYYFRGGVEDNYVNFAGMCWRIVRIDGAGNTKLVLEDKDTTCDSNDYTGNFVYSTEEPNLLIVYNKVQVSDGYGGTYEVDAPVWTRYDHGDKDSNIATVLKKFQNEKLSSYINYLENTNWCVGAKTYQKSGDTYKLLTKSEITSILQSVYSSVSLNNIYYDVYNSNTSLICGSDNLISTYTDGTEIYSSLLTPAEYSYSGGGENMYLINSYAKKGKYMGVTLLFNDVRATDGGYGKNLFVYTNTSAPSGYTGMFESSASDFNATNVIRPVIKLKSSVKYKSGNGTISSPYIVE